MRAVEVIVVADACVDDTEEQVQSLIGRTPYTLRVISHTARSAALTRQVGAQAAQAPTLLFLDDDIAATSGLVRGHLEAPAPHRVGWGYSRPAPLRQASRWQRDAYRWWEDTFTTFSRPGHRFSYRDFFSGNVSMPADVFWAVGGFDSTFTGRLEDYELGYRLLKAGAAFVFAPAAVGDHYDQTDLVQWQRRIRQEGVADVQIARRHPELSNYIFARLYHPSPLGRLIRWLAFAAPQYGERLEPIILAAIDVCERFKLRYRWHQLVRTLRDYNYFCGVAAMLGSRDAYKRWIGEAPQRQRLAVDAPAIDLAALPVGPAYEELFTIATQKGAVIELAGVPLLALPPQPGAEPLRIEHVRETVRTIAHQRYCPALALGMARQQAAQSPALSVHDQRGE